MASFADLITFSRASVGWYFNASGNLVQAAINEPRFDYTAISGRQPGLLIEPAATEENLKTTVSTATVTLPSGATATDLALNVFGVFPGLQVTSSDGNLQAVARTSLTYAFTATTGVSKTIEVYYRAGTSPTYRVSLFNDTTTNVSLFSGDIGAGSVSSTGTGAITKVSEQLCADGLTYRLRLIFTPSESGPVRLGFGPHTTTVGLNAIFVTFFVRTGSVFSTPILTNGSTVTRSADVASVTQASTWFANNSGTFFGDFRVSYADTGTVPEVALFRINSGSYATLGHSVFLGTFDTATGRPNYRLETSSGVVTVQGGSTTYSPGSDVAVKAAVTYSDTVAKLCFSGGTVYSNTPLGTLPDMTSYNMVLGGLAPITVLNLNYKPSTSSDTELQALTA